MSPVDSAIYVHVSLCHFCYLKRSPTQVEHHGHSVKTSNTKVGQAWTNCMLNADQTCSCTQFCLVKKNKKTLDLQSFSKIGKTMKKLQ